MRRNRSQTAKRRSHHAISGMRLSNDGSGTAHLRHRVNPKTGMYRGKVVIDIVAAQKRAARRTKRKEMALRESGRIRENTTEETSTPSTQ